MPFSPELQKRAAAFLERPIPEELKPHYAPGSLADIVVGSCAQGEPLDPELAEIAAMSAESYDEVIAEAQTADLKAYYTECQQLLREIVAAGE